MNFYFRTTNCFCWGFFLLFLTTLFPWSARGTERVESKFETLSQGLEQVIIPQKKGNDPSYLVFLKIDPKEYEFVLLMASEQGELFSLEEWAKKYSLIAAINASMYKEDNLTSTGHMQNDTHVNNDKIGARLGSFFLAEPILHPDSINKLPKADIVERSTLGWKSYLNKYKIRIQNFRLIDPSGAIVWSEDRFIHSSAAIGKDDKGNILFILSQERKSMKAFAEDIKYWYPNISSVMYVEGSGDAKLFVSGIKKESKIWSGRKSFLNIKGDPSQKLPNILGIRKRQ